MKLSDREHLFATIYASARDARRCVCHIMDGLASLESGDCDRAASWFRSAEVAAAQAAKTSDACKVKLKRVNR